MRDEEEEGEDKAATRNKGLLIEFSMMMTTPAPGTHNALMNQTPLEQSASRSFSPCWRSLLPLGLTLLLPLHALAWNSAGHRLIASIAWEKLSSEARAESSRLLREHPNYERWRRKAGVDAPERIVFIEASTWPDEIRKDRRFYSAGKEEPTPTLPGFPDMERRGDWHYVNRPLDDSPSIYPLTGQIDKQLVAQAKILGSREASGVDRHYALPWLIHLVGDAHQPLHASVRLNAAGRWDKLGDGETIINPFNPRKKSSTLHAFWDDLPGPSGLRGERLDTATHALLALYPRPPRSRSSDKWLEESWQIARQSAYPESEEATPTISEAFFETSREIANRRVTEAGYRLAELLNRLLGVPGKRH